MECDYQMPIKFYFHKDFKLKAEHIVSVFIQINFLLFFYSFISIFYEMLIWLLIKKAMDEI